MFICRYVTIASYQKTFVALSSGEKLFFVGDYGCYAEERDGSVYLALGIVSPYNAGTFMPEDQKILQYLFMEANAFHALDFAE